MLSPPDSDKHLSTGRLLKLLSLMWLASASSRIIVLAVPPVIPLIHDDLHMTETQVGILIGLPLVTFAVAAVPGSLLVARLGTLLTIVVGMTVAGLAAAARGAAFSVWTLYAATIVMGFGIAIMQPALPTLVREWLPHRIGLGTAVSTNGLVMGVTLSSALTIPVVLPLLGNSWRLDFVFWALPVLATGLVFLYLAYRSREKRNSQAPSLRAWWPDWRSGVIWLLGLIFGCNNSMYFGANAFLPDYLVSVGRPDLIGAAIGSLNGSQLIASFILLATAERLHRRAWPFLVFGPLAFAGMTAIMLASGAWIVAAAALVGFATAITFVVTMALPPVLSRPDDVHRTTAGMLTISFTYGVIIPVISGAVWDLTGIPWMAFVPLALCAIAITVLGFFLTVIGAKFSANAHPSA